MNYKIVPTKPTEEMKAVIRNEHDVYVSEDALYHVMLAAAPRASEDEALRETLNQYMRSADECFSGRGEDQYWAYMSCAVIKILEGDD